jgi:hypothetical protein
MTGPERLPVQAPPLFHGFRERRTRGQRQRALMGRVYTAIHRARLRWGRG